MDSQQQPSHRVIKQRRARKTCVSCHNRKTRCDVAKYQPCTSCVELGFEGCTVRRRKNARAPTPLEQSSVASQSPEQSRRDAGQTQLVNSTVNSTINNPWIQPKHPAPITPHLYPAEEPQTVDSTGATSLGSYDFGTLADLEDIFSATLGEATPFYEHAAFTFPAAAPPTAIQHVGFDGGIPCHASTIEPARAAFLQSQGCLTLPPPSILRRSMEYYFRFVHPQLPVLDEGSVWSLWQGDQFNLNGFSFVVMRCMLFTVVHLLDIPELAHIGFSSKREARDGTYAQAKLLLDFDVERDPLNNAIGCLLLTYHSPNHNVNRVNCGWLHRAIRYAHIIGAEHFYLYDDPDRVRVLKRLWWGIIFRDRILSLGVARSVKVKLDPMLTEDHHMLSPADFAPEMGRSEVHDTATQVKLAKILNALCLLVNCISPALETVYKHERVDLRVLGAANFPTAAVKEAHEWFDDLRIWHRQFSQIFPSPITLDSTPDAISVFANLVFVYYNSAVMCINLYLILLHETLEAVQVMFPLEGPARAIETVLDDMRARILELLQVRLAKYLPISISAYMAPPLVLQAINVASAGRQQESVEARKLEVWTRTLETQQNHFEGSDAVAIVLERVVTYALSHKDAPDRAPRHRTMAHWLKKPRLLLRLLLRLNSALCTGGLDSELDFPPQLQLETS